MCSFDVSGLFMKVLLDETILICADTLYNIPDSQPCIPKEVFVELLHSAASTVEFSFDNTIYNCIATQLLVMENSCPLSRSKAYWRS